MSDPNKVTRYIAQEGDTVWAPVGSGWRAATIETLYRKDATVRFDTGARESRTYESLRWRRPKLNGADKPQQTEAA